MGPYSADLKKLRVALGMTQRGFAQAVGYNTHRAVGHWERGDTVPRAWALRRIHELYSETIAELGLEIPEAPPPREARPRYEQRRVPRWDVCADCGALIHSYVLCDVLKGKTLEKASAELMAETDGMRRTRVCAECISAEFHRRAILRHARGRYEILRMGRVI